MSAIDANGDQGGGATVVGNTASGNGDQGISDSSEIAGATNVR